MTTALARMIESASGTLTQLTKIRCVESYPLPSGSKFKNLFSWPNTRYLDEEEAAFLKSRGVRLRDNHIKTFSVPYCIYDKMNKVDDPGIASIRITRTLLDVFKLVSEGKAVTEITGAWDSEESPNRNTPNSMSDTQAMREFRAHKDSFLVFRREDEKYDIKLPPFAIPVVLQRNPELSKKLISRSDRREFLSKKVDHKGRKNRNIVFRAHQDYLRDVLNQTSNAVEKLVGDSDLACEIKKLYWAQVA